MKLNKILSRVRRSLIFKLDGVNTRKYMMKYNKWLKNNGMIINGAAKYIHHSVFLDGTDYSKISLGNNVVISLGCVILTHDYSVEAAFLSINQGSKDEAYFLKPVSIGDNCFIGARTIILCGTILGNNCIVGAGSVLPGKVYPDNSIIVGNPGRVIGKTDDWARKKKEIGGFLRGYHN